MQNKTRTNVYKITTIVYKKCFLIIKSTFGIEHNLRVFFIWTGLLRGLKLLPKVPSGEHFEFHKTRFDDIFNELRFDVTHSFLAFQSNPVPSKHVCDHKNICNQLFWKININIWSKFSYDGWLTDCLFHFVNQIIILLQTLMLNFDRIIFFGGKTRSTAINDGHFIHSSQPSSKLSDIDERFVIVDLLPFFTPKIREIITHILHCKNKPVFYPISTVSYVTWADITQWKLLNVITLS